MVAKLIDGYLAEISKDANLTLSNFVDLAEMVSDISRPAHDGLYRAIDMYLKVSVNFNSEHTLSGKFHVVKHAVHFSVLAFHTRNLLYSKALLNSHRR